jgi:DNA topoisomerase-1
MPRHAVERKAQHLRKWLETITELAQEADTFIDACDYDIEGSIIGYTILKYACNNKETIAKRMKYSTLTEEELQKSYPQLLPHLDFSLIEAGLARHEIDWLYGINLSRALTSAAKKATGKYTTLSAGRVQAPTLKFLVAREKAIKTFVPFPYWTIKAKIKIDNSILEATHEKKKIETKTEADAILEACRGKEGTIDRIDVRKFQQPPPTPFDLGSLQNEAYRLFGYTPMRTTKIAQHLYLDALISYPRTSSQKLPVDINYRTILKALGNIPQYNKPSLELLTKPILRAHEGNKEDPAHPAIYPTGKKPARLLDHSERSVYDLVVRRFMSTLAEPATLQTLNIRINVNGQHFNLFRKQTPMKGWLRYYEPYSKTSETPLPPMQEGQTIKVKEVIKEDKFTTPPSRYNPGSLLKKMEKAGIGTKSTRADIIQILQDRKYVQGESLTPTDLGFEITETLQKYCPTATSTALTKNLEEKINAIQSNTETKENAVRNAIKILKPAIDSLKQKEEIVGERLAETIRKAQSKEKTLGTCPDCKTGELIVIHSRKSGKRFIGCTNYFNRTCKTSYPLPQKGTLKITHKKCRACGWPTVQTRIGQRSPWTVCFNPTCPTKKQRKNNT